MDTHTLAVCNLMFLCLYAGTILIYRTMYRGLQPGVRGCDLYIASSLILGAFFAIILLPASLRPPHAVLLSSPLGLLGRLLMHRAFAELMERKRELWRTQIGLAVAGFMLWIYLEFFAVSPSFGWMLLVWGTQYGLIAAMMFRLADDEGWLASWLGGSIATFYAGCHLLMFLIGSPLQSLGKGPGHIWPAVSMLTHGAFAMAFLIVSVSRLQLHMQRETERDELTGLMNRRGILKSAETSLARCQRKKMPISVLMIDLDGFKKANDLLGHAAGDVLLCAVARLLTGMTRGRRDKLARLGGDEFCLLLPDADEREGVRIAERCRASLAEMVVPYFEQELRVSACFGVAHSSDASSSFDELLRCSDEAMYEAKHAGKNRVALANMRAMQRVRQAEPETRLRRVV